MRSLSIKQERSKRQVLFFGSLVFLSGAIGIAIQSGSSLVRAATPVEPSAPLKAIPNRLIDYDRFLSQAQIVGEIRSNRRVSEAEFLRLAAEPGTIILDARSAQRYQELHIQGAKNLTFADITAAELARIIPATTTKILIYCNNNFLNEPIAFAAKSPSASLNIHTYNTLYSYGYQNIYELGPLLDVRTTKLPLVRSSGQIIK